MATICRAYSTENEVDAAVDRLLGAGVPGEEIRVLAGERVRDHRDDPVGGYAGSRAADEPVGSFADTSGTTREDMGSYAGEADRQRRGSFGDIDRDIVATYRGGARRARVASHHGLEKMLMDVGLDKRSAESDVAALHEGRILVLVRTDKTAEALAQTLDVRTSA